MLEGGLRFTSMGAMVTRLCFRTLKRKESCLEGVRWLPSNACRFAYARIHAQSHVCTRSVQQGSEDGAGVAVCQTHLAHYVSSQLRNLVVRKSVSLHLGGVPGTSRECRWGSR